MRSEIVTSTKNPKISDLLALQEKSRLRREKGLFVLEGRREITRCLDSGYIPEALFYCKEIISQTDLESILAKASSANGRFEAIEVSANVYDKAAYRGGTEGVIAEMRSKDNSLEKLSVRKDPIIVVLEEVEKPGNIGAVLRSADAAGVDAVIICNPLTDLYNPNLIRASVGAVFTVKTATASSPDVIKWLKDRHIQILTAQLQDSLPYYDSDMTGGTAIVMGTEDTGLSEIWRAAADRHIMIPMQGRLDSLNVSVSAGILMFEAVRQRRFSHGNS